MRVAKWGNSLAIRIPQAAAQALELKEGDEVEVRAAGARDLEVGRDLKLEQAIARMRAMQWELPPGWKFDREEANARGTWDE